MNNESLSNKNRPRLDEVLTDVERLLTELNNDAYEIGFAEGVKSVDKQQNRSINIDADLMKLINSIEKTVALANQILNASWRVFQNHEWTVVKSFEDFEHEVKQKSLKIQNELIGALNTLSGYQCPNIEKKTQRTWVGLEAEDRLCAKYMQDAPAGIEAVIDYIEAKLKDKNT